MSCVRRSQGPSVRWNESVAGTLSGVWGRVVSSTSDQLGDSRQFVFRRVKGCRKSAFFSPLWRSPGRLGSAFSVGFLWQIKSPARQSGVSWRAGSGATGAEPEDIAGQGGQGSPSAGAFFLSPVGASPTQAADPDLGKAGRESPGCPGWAAVSYVAGTPSRCHPAHRHGNRRSCTSKFPEPQPRVPRHGPDRDPPAALPLSGVRRSPPNRPSPASPVGGQELILGVTAGKSLSGSFCALTRGSEIGEG